jgi:uncharacterized membrane protein
MANWSPVGTYNKFAGQSLERIGALSDGVFAIAMTLLVLELHVPVASAIHSERDLWRALVALAPRLIPYVMSFATLGIFWIGQQTQLNHFERSDRDLAWIHIAFLFAVTMMPFSTALLGQFITFRTALLVYWLNIWLLGVALFASWRYARRAGLVQAGISPGLVVAMERRIVVAQSLYAVGALLCLVNTYWSIAFVAAVQLNYIVAPRFRLLARLG